MSWLGKILGGVAGFSFGGPLGALVGATLGHQFFDKAAARADAERAEADPDQAKLAFFTATFYVMGHIAKADGRVTREEVDMAKEVMDQWDFDPQSREFARNLFRQGRDSEIPLDEVLDQLREECRGSNIIRAFVEIQIDTAIVDGSLHPAERRVLEHICQRLRLPSGTLEAMLREAHTSTGVDSDSSSTDEAYALLELKEDCSDEDLKRSYRRMMNRYHPDKLASKGLPDEMMRMATEKAREIKAAYEHLRQVRGTK